MGLWRRDLYIVGTSDNAILGYGLLTRSNLLGYSVAEILKAAWSMLKKGGLLVYATCSILKAENENQIAQFLAQTPNAQEIRFEQNHAKHGWQILTGENGCDGFYYAKLKKL